MPDSSNIAPRLPQRVVVHQKELATPAVLNGILITDAQPVVRIVKPGGIYSFACQPKIRLEYLTALAQLLSQIPANIIRTDDIVP